MRIRLTEATVAFGDVVAVGPITTTIDGPAIVALAGPSGSGKTTLLGALAGAVPLASGAMVVDTGTGVEHPRLPSFSWVSQAANALPDRSALDNVMLGALGRGEALADAVADAESRLGVMGLDHRRDQPARTLSGGELQRLAFARALAAERAVILADEPTASLDEVNTRMLCARLRDLARDRLIVVATHDPIVMEACDRVIDVRALSHRSDAT